MPESYLLLRLPQIWKEKMGEKVRQNGAYEEQFLHLCNYLILATPFDMSSPAEQTESERRKWGEKPAKKKNCQIAGVRTWKTCENDEKDIGWKKSSKCSGVQGLVH